VYRFIVRINWLSPAGAREDGPQRAACPNTHSCLRSRGSAAAATDGCGPDATDLLCIRHRTLRAGRGRRHHTTAHPRRHRSTERADPRRSGEAAPGGVRSDGRRRDPANRRARLPIAPRPAADQRRPGELDGGRPVRPRAHLHTVHPGNQNQLRQQLGAVRGQRARGGYRDHDC